MKLFIFLIILISNSAKANFPIDCTLLFENAFKSQDSEFFQKLDLIIDHTNSEIRFAHNLGPLISKLPPHLFREYFAPQDGDYIDGWFDEYILPHGVFIRKDANFLTLIHEIKHAIQLGNQRFYPRNLKVEKIDLAIWEAKQAIYQYFLNDKILMIKALRMYEAASEISAYFQSIEILSNCEIDNKSEISFNLEQVLFYFKRFNQIYLEIEGKKVKEIKYLKKSLDLIISSF